MISIPYWWPKPNIRPKYVLLMCAVFLLIATFIPVSSQIQIGLFIFLFLSLCIILVSVYFFGYFHRLSYFKSSLPPHETYEVIDSIFPSNSQKNYRAIRHPRSQSIYSCFSLNNSPSKPGAYLPLVEKLILQSLSRSSRCLHLGGGGMAMPLQLYIKNPAILHSIVEIDAGFIRAAKKYFLPLVPKASPRFTIIHQSVETFVKKSTDTFDVIFQDLFVGDQAPTQFSSKKWLRQLKNLLRPRGIVVINIGNINHQAELLNMHNLHHYSKGIFRYYECLVDSPNCYVLLKNHRSGIVALLKNFDGRSIARVVY